MNETKFYEFDRDQLGNLSFLLNLVHYDDLAEQIFRELPQELVRDIQRQAWLANDFT